MRILYHLWLSPFSRKVRVVMHEKNLEFQLKGEKTWERREEFLALNPAGEVPVLVEQNGTALAESGAICEYLEELYPDPRLMGRDPLQRAEIRRLVAWFDLKFNQEVTRNILNEKMMKRFLGLGEPSSSAIRAGSANIHYHLDYIGYLAESRSYLAGRELSLADIAAGSHLSCLDYLGDVPWEDHKPAKEWYARLKSRPSFQQLLKDHIPGFPPAKHYTNLDF